MGRAQNDFSPARIFGRPTADQLWLGPAQRRALTFLRTPTERGTKLLIGPRGCGKSTLLDAFLAQLEETIYFRSRDRWESGAALLNALLDSTDLLPMEGTDVARRNLFTSYLEHERSLGHRIIIAIDDAEQLTPDAWAELFRLRAIRCEDGYQPEFILAGRPQTQRSLQSADCGGWHSVRLVTHSLKAVDAAEVGQYIQQRLLLSGLPDYVFTEAARELIGHLANGSLTAANLLCQMSLVHARKQSARGVDESIVRSARMAIGQRPSLSRAPGRPPSPRPKSAGTGELIVTRGDQVVARYPLMPHMLLGRSEYNHVCLKSTDVSRHHAAIVKTPRGYEIVDLDSKSGLFINGEAAARHTLSDRDVIGLGPYRLEVLSPMVSRRKPARRAVDRRLPPTEIPQTP